MLPRGCVRGYGWSATARPSRRASSSPARPDAEAAVPGPLEGADGSWSRGASRRQRAADVAAPLCGRPQLATSRTQYIQPPWPSATASQSRDQCLVLRGDVRPSRRRWRMTGAARSPNPVGAVASSARNAATLIRSGRTVRGRRPAISRAMRRTWALPRALRAAMRRVTACNRRCGARMEHETLVPRLGWR